MKILASVSRFPFSLQCTKLTDLLQSPELEVWPFCAKYVICYHLEIESGQKNNFTTCPWFLVTSEKWQLCMNSQNVLNSQPRHRQTQLHADSKTDSYRTDWRTMHVLPVWDGGAQQQQCALDTLNILNTPQLCAPDR